MFPTCRDHMLLATRRLETYVRLAICKFDPWHIMPHCYWTWHRKAYCTTYTTNEHAVSEARGIARGGWYTLCCGINKPPQIVTPPLSSNSLSLLIIIIISGSLFVSQFRRIILPALMCVDTLLAEAVPSCSSWGRASEPAVLFGCEHAQ